MRTELRLKSSRAEYNDFQVVVGPEVKPVKRCTKCGVNKPFNAFSGNTRKPDGLDQHCRECIRERIRNKKSRYMLQSLCTDCGAALGAACSRRCEQCLKRHSGTDRSRELRAAVMHAYGGESRACACCGEDEPTFLTLDHVNNGGGAHRRAKGNQGVYHELRRAGYPPGFRILCFNCNLARGYYGGCPHENASRELAPTAAVAEGTPDCSPVRRCTKCRQERPWSAFYADKGTQFGLQSRCRTCTRDASIARLNAARYEALAHYSGGALRCACCGECGLKFLALDHINGEGPRMPGDRPGGNAFYDWLKREGFPPGLQVLCHNCNCAKGRIRECLHQAAPAGR
jgi:hypothetical protein